MIAIHPIHRRLAELILKASKEGSSGSLSQFEQMDLDHCLQANARLVYLLDSLKELSLHAYDMGDMEWQHEICKQIDELEAKCI